MTKRSASHSDENSHGGKRHQTERLSDSHHVHDQLEPNTMRLAMPSMYSITRWLSSEISSSLPPIPKILDQKLEETVFRHPAFRQLGPSYERLEWLGDAYLELIASGLIHQTFTSTAAGRCSQLRELLIRNSNLAQYFRDYGLQSKAQLPPEIQKATSHGRGRSKDKDLVKTQGDMFEAYVAAAIISDPENGMANTVSWLKTLFGRTIKDQIVQNEEALKDPVGGANLMTHHTYLAAADQGSKMTARDQLQDEIGSKGVKIRYEDIPGNAKEKNLRLPLFTVGVYLDGWGERNKLLGTGTALAKKEAAQKAAAVALANKKLLKTYKEKKRIFVEALRAAEGDDAHPAGG